MSETLLGSDTSRDALVALSGTVTKLVTWLKNYKIPEGKGENQLVSELPSSPQDAVKIIETCNERYQVGTFNWYLQSILATRNNTWLMFVLVNPTPFSVVMQELKSGKAANTDGFYLGT